MPYEMKLDSSDIIATSTSTLLVSSLEVPFEVGFWQTSNLTENCKTPGVKWRFLWRCGRPQLQPSTGI